MIFQSIKKFVMKNATQILTISGIFGFGVSCISAARAYEECKELARKRKDELKVEKLPAGEIVKTCWKPCVLPLLCFGTSTGCILYAQNILLKKNAALVALYKASETALSEFKKETKKQVSGEVYKQIQDKATENQMQQEKVPEKSDRKTYLDNERDLWYDAVYGGYFYATELEIYKAFEETRDDLKWAKNTSLGTDYKECVPLGNLYFRLHGDPIEIGDDFGYYVEDYMHDTFSYEIEGDCKIAPNGMKAFVLRYDKAKPMD